MITAEFLITSLIVVLIPGTGVLFTVSAGLFLGRRASLYAALGCTLGILPHLLASIVGLAALLHVSALAFHLLKLAGHGLERTVRGGLDKAHEPAGVLFREKALGNDDIEPDRAAQGGGRGGQHGFGML